MQLNKLPGPWRITFDTNPHLCNLHCIMCEGFSKKGSKPENNSPKIQMSSNLVEKVVQEGVSLGELKEIIPSTMGEPLLYDEFDVFISLCKQNNLKLNLTTNGTFPKRSIKTWSELLLPICSDIKISWNGFTKETDEKIMEGRNYDKALANLKELLNYKAKLTSESIMCSSITLQLTFLEMNYREIPDIVKMARELGINRIKGHHLWVHNPEAEKWSMRKDKESITRWNEITNKVIKLNNSFEPDKQVKLENIFPISTNSDTLLEESVCPFLGREAWISNVGVFSPCCAPDNLRKQLGDFGNLNEISLQDIWNSEQYNQLCRNYENISLCKNCNMKKKREDVYKFGY